MNILRKVALTVRTGANARVAVIKQEDAQTAETHPVSLKNNVNIKCCPIFYTIYPLINFLLRAGNSPHTRSCKKYFHNYDLQTKFNPYLEHLHKV